MSTVLVSIGSQKIYVEGTVLGKTDSYCRRSKRNRKLNNKVQSPVTVLSDTAKDLAKHETSTVVSDSRAVSWETWTMLCLQWHSLRKLDDMKWALSSVTIPQDPGRHEIGIVFSKARPEHEETRNRHRLQWHSFKIGIHVGTKYERSVPKMGIVFSDTHSRIRKTWNWHWIISSSPSREKLGMKLSLSSVALWEIWNRNCLQWFRAIENVK